MSDAGVVHSVPDMVVLPACVCGNVITIKTIFTVDELATSNMLVDGLPTPTHTTATLAQALETQMIAAGK